MNLHDSLTGPWRWKGEIVYRAREGEWLREREGERERRKGV